MFSDPLVQINASTGSITGTPHVVGQFLACLLFSEYRNGQLLSTTRREITFIVVDDVNSVEDLTTGGGNIFQVTPNPASDRISWQVELEQLRVLDYSGRCFLLKQDGNTELDTHLFYPGIYHLFGTTRTGKQIYSTLIVAR